MSVLRENKKILFIISAAVILTVIICLLLLLRINKRNSTEQVISPPAGVGAVEDLIIPREFSDIYDLKWYYYRDRKEIWTEEMVKEHWIDTRGVLIRYYEEKNDEIMSGLFRRTE